MGAPCSYVGQRLTGDSSPRLSRKVNAGGRLFLFGLIGPTHSKSIVGEEGEYHRRDYRHSEEDKKSQDLLARSIPDYVGLSDWEQA